MSNGYAMGARLTVKLSVAHTGGFAPGTVQSVRTTLYGGRGDASGDLITVRSVVYRPEPTLFIAFDDDALLESWSECFNSQAVQAISITIGR